MLPKPKPESIYERILREARELRATSQQRLEQQIDRINERIRTHGNDQDPR